MYCPVVEVIELNFFGAWIKCLWEPQDTLFFQWELQEKALKCCHFNLSISHATGIFGILCHRFKAFLFLLQTYFIRSFLFSVAQQTICMSLLETSYVLYSCTHCLSSSLVGHVSTPWQVVTTYSVPTNSTPGCGSDGVEFKDDFRLSEGADTCNKEAIDWLHLQWELFLSEHSWLQILNKSIFIN